MDYQRILQQTIDLHVHIGPEIIPRKFALPELRAYESGKLKGMAVKNHFFPTIAMEDVTRADNTPFIVHSVVLNHYVGGFNPAVIRASAELSRKPIIVWFPTLHAENFLQGRKFEIPEEWIAPTMRATMRPRPREDIRALSVLDARGNIADDVRDVLSAIAECGAILATGHISWEESRVLVRCAAEEFGIKRIIVTHPIYQAIDMPVEVQQELAACGALMEHCSSMYAIDKIPIARIARQIRKVGAKNCIVSSDVGQTFGKSPSEALADFISFLTREGITEMEIETMLVGNPSKLIG